MEMISTHLFYKPPVPTTDCTGKVIIVTGANIGLGLEAARHYTRLNASKVIIGCRSASKGNAAKADIEATTGRQGVVEFWELDLSSYASTIAFSERVLKLERLDAVICNASVAARKYEKAEDNEQSITVNVVSTYLLVLKVLPALDASARKYGTQPVLNVVVSSYYRAATFPQRNAENLFEAVNDEKNAFMEERYPLSKLFQILIGLELAVKLTAAKSPVTFNMLCPGLCKTSLTRNSEGFYKYMIGTMKFMLGRTAEEGSRVLVWAGLAGPETHGGFISECQLKPERLEDIVVGEEGLRLRAKLWPELMAKLEKIKPGVTKVVQ